MYGMSYFWLWAKCLLKFPINLIISYFVFMHHQFGAQQLKIKVIYSLSDLKRRLNNIFNGLSLHGNRHVKSRFNGNFFEKFEKNGFEAQNLKITQVLEITSLKCDNTNRWDKNGSKLIRNKLKIGFILTFKLVSFTHRKSHFKKHLL